MPPETESRRSFFRKSLIVSLVAVQPAILTGLVRANGGGQGTTGTETKTTFATTSAPETTNPFTTVETTVGSTQVETTVGPTMYA